MKAYIKIAGCQEAVKIMSFNKILLIPKHGEPREISEFDSFAIDPTGYYIFKGASTLHVDGEKIDYFLLGK